MKFLGKKFDQIRRYTAKAVVLLTLVAIVIPFSLFMPAPAYAQSAPQPAGNSDSLGCGFSSTLDPAVCLSNVVYVFTVGLGSGLAYVTAFMLDTSVSLSLNSTGYALSFLSSGWTTARDLANMAFILILVYIAFMIMFQAETTGTIRMLAWVIFIALIINFSFFFTRVVIDVSNILAVQFYNSIGVGPNGQVVTMAQTFTATNKDTGTLANVATGAATSAMPNGTLQNTKDLTASIMQGLNVQQLFSNDSFKNFTKQTGFGTRFITLTFLYLAMGACYFILAAMFLAVSVKFITRIVVLWFLIIASPLAFICKAIPRSEISSWYDKWQHELINHAFYPAFFLFIFFFISTIMAGLNANGGILGDLAKNLNGLASNPNLGDGVFVMSLVAAIAIRLGFVIAMLYIALKSSEYMGVKGGEVAHRMTSYAFGQTGRFAAASVGFTGRQTFGRAGTALASNKYISSRAENAPALLKGTLRGIDRGSKAVGNTLGKASYDPRNAPGVSILKKGVEKISGSTVNTGSPDKGGFMAQAKERDDKRKAAEKEASQKDRAETNMKNIEKLAEISARHDELEAKEKAGTITQVEKDQKNILKHQMGTIEKKINGLSKNELGGFPMSKIQKVIKHLNKDTIKKISENENYTEKDKEAVRMEHDKKMGEIAGEKGVKNAQKTIEELRQIREELVKNAGILPGAISHLTDAIKSGSTMSPQALSDIRKQIRNEMSLTDYRVTHATGDIEKREAAHGKEKLKEAMAHINDIGGHLENIPEHIGGKPNANEFLVK